MKIQRIRFSCWIPRATVNVLRICNNFCFSLPKKVARTRLNVMLRVHCLSCSLKIMLRYVMLCYVMLCYVMLVIRNVG
jgi:hypothetical protein